MTDHIWSKIFSTTQNLAGIAQLVEQQTVMQQVLGLIPTPNSTWLGVDSPFHPSVGR